MTTAACKKSGRKHTPITSKAQRGKFGSELARRRAGKKRRMKGITTAELRSHLKESKGKKLPKYSKKSKKKSKKKKSLKQKILQKMKAKKKK